MSYREKIEQHLNLEGPRLDRTQALLGTLSAAYDAGGETAVTTALSEKMQTFEAEFHSKLTALEKIL